MKPLLRIVNEPTGAVYQALLRFAARCGSLFTLVWRDQLKFDGSVEEVLRRLSPELVSESRTHEWPGTVLLGHLATVRRFRLSDKSLDVLGEARGLYDWEAPSRPEDLAFYSSDGRPWLGSIAHERDAFVYPSEIDVRQLAAHVPGLRVNAGGSDAAG